VTCYRALRWGPMLVAALIVSVSCGGVPEPVETTEVSRPSPAIEDVKLAEDAIVGVKIYESKRDLQERQGESSPFPCRQLPGAPGEWDPLEARFGDQLPDDDQLLLITSNGKIIRMGVDGISRIGRATQGVRVIQTEEGDKVVSAIRTAETTAVKREKS